MNKIDIKQVEYIYNNYIIYDFPKNERRPLNKIIDLINHDLYIPYAFIFKNEIIGYAFFYGLNNIFICDYFGIVFKYRNKGYGSLFLKECLKLFKNQILYFEVEKPEEPNLEIKNKRIQFYLKNELILNDIEMKLYYVDYVILSNKKTSINDVKSLYEALYDRHFYNKYIEFKNKKN